MTKKGEGEKLNEGMVLEKGASLSFKTFRRFAQKLRGYDSSPAHCDPIHTWIDSALSPIP